MKWRKKCLTGCQSHINCGKIMNGWSLLCKNKTQPFFKSQQPLSFLIMSSLLKWSEHTTVKLLTEELSCTCCLLVKFPHHFLGKMKEVISCTMAIWIMTTVVTIKSCTVLPSAFWCSVWVITQNQQNCQLAARACCRQFFLPLFGLSVQKSLSQLTSQTRLEPNLHYTQ